MHIWDALTADEHAVRQCDAVSAMCDLHPGFCGETEAEHQDTLNLMTSTPFDNAFMFAYSRR